MRAVYGERARDDITKIYDSIGLHNPVAAEAVEDLIRATCEALSDFPYASAATDEPGVRRIPLVRFPYTTFCRVNAVSDIVEIARVLHAARVRDLGKMPDDD